MLERTRAILINDLRYLFQTFEVNYKKSSFKGKLDFKIEFDDLKKYLMLLINPSKKQNLYHEKKLENLEYLILMNCNWLRIKQSNIVFLVVLLGPRCICRISKIKGSAIAVTDADF